VLEDNGRCPSSAPFARHRASDVAHTRLVMALSNSRLELTQAYVPCLLPLATNEAMIRSLRSMLACAAQAHGVRHTNSKIDPFLRLQGGTT